MLLVTEIMTAFSVVSHVHRVLLALLVALNSEDMETHMQVHTEVDMTVDIAVAVRKYLALNMAFDVWEFDPGFEGAREGSVIGVFPTPM